MGEDIATQVSDKGLLSTLHKELPWSGKKKVVNLIIIIKKTAKDLNKLFTKE